MQTTTRCPFTQLRDCTQLLKKTVSAGIALQSIPQTDFTFGNVESSTDKALWYFSRSIISTSFMADNSDKSQRLLENIFGPGDARVQEAMNTYCDPFIQNHQDLSDAKKKELFHYCILHVGQKLETNGQNLRDNFPPLCTETVPLLQQIHKDNLIRFEDKELEFFEYLSKKDDSESWESHLVSFGPSVRQPNFENIDTLISILQKIIECVNFDCSEWTKL